MAVWATVARSHLRGSNRLDAEFWKPDYVAAENAVRAGQWLPLGELVTAIRKGIFSILADEYVEAGVPFYRSANVGRMLPREHEVVYITEDRDEEASQTSLREGDVMLAKTGKEAASVVLRSRVNISQDVVGIRVRRDRINPFFLAAFLNSRLGRLQMQRWFQGQVQPHLALADAREIAVPLVEPRMQEQVEQLVRQAAHTKASAEGLLVDASNRYAAAIGLSNGRERADPSFVVSSVDAFGGRRLDAEFFTPRMDRLRETLSAGGKALSDVATLSRRVFDSGERAEFNYIEIGDLASDGSVASKRVSSVDAPDRARWVVRRDDVITSTVRPLRKLTAIIDGDEDGSVCSSGFAVLSPTEIPSPLLFAFLRLPEVCELLDLHATASMYPAVAVADLLGMPFAVPADDEAYAIVQAVERGRNEGRRAEELLNEAIALVENSGAAA